MNRIPKIGFNEQIIVIGTGSYQVPRHYQRLQKELYVLSYHSLVPDLGTDEPSMTLEKIGAQLAAVEAHVGIENGIRFLHSSALNYGSRHTENIGGIIMNACGVDDKTYRFNTTEAELLPPRHANDFDSAIKFPRRGYVTTIDKEAAARLIYGGCSRRDKRWATSIMKPKVRSPNEPENEDFDPSLALGYIGNDGDPILPRAYQRAIARLVFNLEVDWLPCGHSPNIQIPKEEAELIDEIIRRPQPRYNVRPNGS